MPLSKSHFSKKKKVQQDWLQAWLDLGVLSIFLISTLSAQSCILPCQRKGMKTNTPFPIIDSRNPIGIVYLLGGLLLLASDVDTR